MKRQISAMGTLFVRALREEQGGEMMEYAMTLGIMSLGVYALVEGVGGKVLAMWQRIDAALAAIG